MLRHFGNLVRHRIAGTILLLLAMLWMATFANAAEDCAGTPEALVQYLDKAETQSTPYKIKVLAGTYNLSNADSTWLVPTSLTVEGGYVDCNTRGTSIASATVIDTASALFPGFQLESSEGTLTIEGLTITGGNATVLRGGVVTYGSGSLIVTHSRITGSQAVLSTNDGTMTLEDVLIDGAPIDNIAHCSALVDFYGNNTATFKFVTVQTNSNENLCIDVSYGHHNTARMYNSIVWPGNIWMDGSTWQQGDVFDVKLVNSLFNQVVAIRGTSSEQASLHVDPLWTDPASGNFTLQVPPNPQSPAVNTGALAAQLPGGISSTDTDIAGNPRAVGSAPDMGAFESAVDDAALFTVTTTTDCSTPLNQPSCGSLRDALARAMAPTQTAPVKTIKFAILDAMSQPSCPAKIHISSGLPDITSDIVIDGYTQGSINQSNPPLSWPNDDPTVFNASLCVEVIGPGTGYGLRVPSGSNGSLTLRGVALGDFAQGVMLAGGANHQIAGNQFGGLASGFTIHGFSNAGVRVETGAPVIIGGDNPADRNVFLNANSSDNSNAAGVIVGYGANGAAGACQIVGNLLGIWPDGMSADPNNENGVLINGSGCAVRGNYLAGNVKDAIHLLGGSHNVLQNNVIGPRITPGVPFFYNPGLGIHVTNGANDNIIGAGEGFVGSPDSYENTITQMNAGGIVVANSTGNTIRGNSIYFNGNDVGLNIDLGGDGPTANDAGDADGGPNAANDLMNYPVPNSVVWGSSEPPQPGFVALTVRGQLDAQAGFYQIDAYYDVACSATGRGGGTWVGGAPYTAFFTGTGAFEVPVSIPFLSYDSKEGRVSVTATQLGVAHQSTSEFSACLSVDTIFANDFER
jgi:hypothetical protein